jgi:uncharacterized membrane protein YfcA
VGGGLAGGWMGARLQIRLQPAGIRLFVAIVLTTIAVLLVLR